MKRRETRLRAVTRQDEREAGHKPARTSDRLRMQHEHRAEKSERDADRADEKIFPHRFETVLVAVIRDKRSRHERRQLDRDPHERQRPGRQSENHRPEERDKERIVERGRHVRRLRVTGGDRQIKETLRQIRRKENRR